LDGFTWNIDRAQAALLYRLLLHQTPNLHEMYDPSLDRVMRQCGAYLALNPWRDVHGNPLPICTKPLLAYTAQEASVGITDDQRRGIR